LAAPDYEWSFPDDHWARNTYKTEWWYFTGHVRSVDDPARRFGYQFTFFRVGLLPDMPQVHAEWATNNIVMGHAAITDLANGRHMFSEVVYRDVAMLAGFGLYPDSTIVWSRAPSGTEGRWTLRWNGAAFDFNMIDDWQQIAFDMSTRPAKPLAFQGPNGFSRKTQGDVNASLYYSFTRLETVGQLRLGGETIRVEGVSWMDKEFGSNQLAEHQTGWDWYSLQLDDGRDIMLYVLRDSIGGIDHQHGTVVSADGNATYLASNEWTAQTTEEWESPRTGAIYPAGWTVTIPSHDLVLTVAPMLADQENASRQISNLFYWEGAVAVLAPGGRPLGRGYVELTGYGTSNRPAI
jgi:predicted secreted hydrolase